MAERKEEANTNGALALLHQIAGNVVDRRNMIGVDRVAQAERIGKQGRSEQDRRSPRTTSAQSQMRILPPISTA